MEEGLKNRLCAQLALLPTSQLEDLLALSVQEDSNIDEETISAVLEVLAEREQTPPVPTGRRLRLGP